MPSNIKSYYSGKGFRIFILTGVVANFGYGIFRLSRGIFVYDEYLYTIAHTLLYFIAGTFFLFLYVKARYVPVAKSGIGWIIIKQGMRNRGFLRAQSRVKNVKIKKTDVDYIHNGIFSLMICTLNQYRYFLYGLAKQERKDLSQRLFSG